MDAWQRMPPSSSPMRQPPPMYSYSSVEEGEQSNEALKALSEMVAALKLGGTNAVEIEEITATMKSMFGESLGDDVINGMAQGLMDRLTIQAPQRQQSNTSSAAFADGEPISSSTTRQQSYAKPPESQSNARGRDQSASFDEDVTPMTNNSTPMSFASRTPTPSESVRRGRDRPLSRSRSRSRSNIRTPMGSLFSHKSSTPTPGSHSAKMEGRSPARRARSQSPMLRRFFGMNGKPDVSPDNPQGPTPEPGRSGLPPTPARPIPGPMATETPAVKSTVSYPSPPSTTGNTFCSPTLSQSQWTPGSTRRNVQMDAAPTGSGPLPQQSIPPVAQPDVSMPSTAQPACNAGFQTNVQPNVDVAAPSPPAPTANVPPSSIPVNVVPTQIPLFSVDLTSKPKITRTRNKGVRRGGDKRAYRAGGPEKPLVQPRPLDTFQQSMGSQFPPSAPEINRTYSADSAIQQNGPTNIFIGTPPSMPQQQQAHHESPKEMEISPEIDSHPAQDAPTVQFNIGAGGKSKPSHRTGRSRRNPRKVASPGRGSVHRQHGGIFPRTSPPKETKAPSSFGIGVNTSQDSAESSGGQTLRTESTCSSEVDYTGRRALVSSLREEARDAYTKHDFRSAAMKYTTALKVHAGEPTLANESDDLRAVLLANRAAALLMVNAYEAAGADCQVALKYISDLNATPVTLASDGGPALRAKLFARMGKALLRLGKLPEAEQAFYNAMNTANATLAIAHQIGFSEETEQSKRFLTQLITDAKSGMIEVNRCREAVEELAKFDNVSSACSTPTARRNSMQALLFVNKALEFAPGAIGFHEKKLSWLASLKRWREVAGHCERLAASYTQFDGLFEDDLIQWNPFPGVQRAESLMSTFFDISDPVESSTKKLGTRAAAEAAIRLPHSLLPFYLRGLRLEERWAQASSVIESLEKFLELAEGLNSYQDLQMKFAWFPREKDKLNRTSAGKNRGDSLFRNGDYQLAAAQYTSCLTIDGEGLPDGVIGEVSNAGGRLHAILHCNRAACLMALKRFHEAVTDCTSALRIHSHYMKAMLRRSRCYARLQRYEEATVEYNRWLELVDKAKRSPNDPDLATTPCLFDSPKEINDDELKKVKLELEDVNQSKRAAENASRSNASFSSSRRDWYQESFGGSDPGDAQQRREQWYNQKSSNSRRWDSFAGRSPKRGENKNARQQQRSQSYRSESQGGGSSHRHQHRVPQSSGSDATLDHYSVLEVSRNATEAQIKKAYRKMALKYHPDKNKAPEAADKFRRVKMAYEILNDPAARRKYDAELLWTRTF